jgi:hypothetical protein
VEAAREIIDFDASNGRKCLLHLIDRMQYQIMPGLQFGALSVSETLDAFLTFMLEHSRVTVMGKELFEMSRSAWQQDRVRDADSPIHSFHDRKGSRACGPWIGGHYQRISLTIMTRHQVAPVLPHEHGPRI